MSENFEDRLRALFDEHKNLLTLLDRAESLAQDRDIFARRRGNEGNMTLEAALTLAIAVWGVEAERRQAGSD